MSLLFCNYLSTNRVGATSLMLLLVLLSSFSWATVYGQNSDATAQPQKSWMLYHAIVRDGDSAAPVFVPRGRVTLSLKDDKSEGATVGDGAATPTTTATAAAKKKLRLGAMDPDASPFRVTLQHEENVITPDFIKQLLEPNAWYQLKLVPDDDATAVPVITTIPACEVRRANFRDELVLMLGSRATVMSLSYVPLASPLAPPDCAVYRQDNDDENDSRARSFDSRLRTESAIPGMMLRTVLPDYQPPPGLHILKTPSAAGGPAAKLLGGQTAENAPADPFPLGFLKRYWYILLPMLIINFMAAEPPPEQQQQQQGHAAGPGGGPAAAAGAATAIAGAAAAAGAAEANARRRRGKRD